MSKRTALLIAAMAIAVPAQAQEATVDPDHIMTVLKDAGYTAEAFNDDADFRQILTRTGNHQYLVEMYDCVDGKACKSIGFFSNFPVEDKPTKEKLDAYGGPRENTRIYLDRRGETNMRQEFEVNSEAALTDELFLARLKTWETMVNGLREYLVQPAGTPAATTERAGAATEATASAPATPAAGAS